MSFKEKSYEFMQKHPKFTKGIISGSAALMTIGGCGVVASADDVVTGNTTIQTTIDIDSIADTLVGGASTAFSTGVTKAVPVLGAVIGFNVVVRLVRRFIKG